MVEHALRARKGGTPSFFRSRGFSLVELMMSVVLIAIGATLALPSYRDMVEKRQVTSRAEQLAAVVSSAQGRAMKVGSPTAVSSSKSDGGYWCIAADAESFCDELIHNVAGSGFTFDSVRGFVAETDTGFEVELRSPGGDFRIDLMVNKAGRVILCSPDTDHAVPGYPLCPRDSDDDMIVEPASPS